MCSFARGQFVLSNRSAGPTLVPPKWANACWPVIGHLDLVIGHSPAKRLISTCERATYFSVATYESNTRTFSHVARFSAINVKWRSLVW